MAMGTRRRRQRQGRLWISHQQLAKGPGHRFHRRMNELLEMERSDEFAEKQCARFYAENNGRPSLTPAIYFFAHRSRNDQQAAERSGNAKHRIQSTGPRIAEHKSAI
jgi:hypothetical protein